MQMPIFDLLNHDLLILKKGFLFPFVPLLVSVKSYVIWNMPTYMFAGYVVILEPEVKMSSCFLYGTDGIKFLSNYSDFTDFHISLISLIVSPICVSSSVVLIIPYWETVVDN